MTVSSVNAPIKPFGNTRFCGRGRASGRTHTMCQMPSLVVPATKARFEPKLPDVAQRSNGSNLAQSGRSAIARYAYS